MKNHRKGMSSEKTKSDRARKVKSFCYYLLLVPISACLLVGCSDNIEEPNPITLYNLYRLDRISNGTNLEWKEAIHTSRGSVGRRGSGSKTIWSRKNDYGIGVYLSANHVYNISGWSTKNPEVFNVFNENLGIFEGSQLPPTTGSLDLGNKLSSDFPYIHFAISEQATNTTILPEEDFYLGLIDGQTVLKGPFPQYPEKIKIDLPLQIFDPLNRSISTKTWDIANSGNTVFGIGFPLDHASFPNGAVAIGKVLSDPEAIETVKKLQASEDSEGNIPYKPEVEFFMDAQGVPGMSGGGVFTKEGKLLGIMVRASDQEKAPKIIRVVRIEYIINKLISLVESLSDEQKAEVYKFLGREISSL